MKTSESQAALVTALLASRKAFPKIAKNKPGQAGHRTFMYAPLDEVLDAVMPALMEHGLLLTQGTEGHELVTRLDHISGEWREHRMPINAEHANMQSYGIELTYRRRYAIQPMLGITTEEDTDGKDGLKKGRKGVDHTRETQGPGAISATREAFSELSPDWQAWIEDLATQVENTFASSGPNAAQDLIDVQTKAQDLEGLHIAALYSKLGSSTKSALRALTRK